MPDRSAQLRPMPRLVVSSISCACSTLLALRPNGPRQDPRADPDSAMSSRRSVSPAAASQPEAAVEEWAARRRCLALYFLLALRPELSARVREFAVLLLAELAVARACGSAQTGPQS